MPTASIILFLHHVIKHTVFNRTGSIYTTQFYVIFFSSAKMPESFEVTSEIYSEYDYKTSKKSTVDGNVVSQFPFTYPMDNEDIKYDKDGDIDVPRPKKDKLVIEHSGSTELSLVGLQVWRGGLLLADLLLQMGSEGLLQNTRVLELGAGTGLASFVAAMFAQKVVCTDLGAMLALITQNATNNKHVMKSDFKVMDLDFTDTKWSAELNQEIELTNIVLAADVIYDDDITAAFITTLHKVLNTSHSKTLYMALEQRYVFTKKHLDTTAPCYDTFLTLLNNIKDSHADYKWKAEKIPLDFPQYFQYNRVKELVLWKITSTRII